MSNCIDVKIYEDGTRTIVVFKNASQDVKTILTGLLTTIAQGTVNTEETKNVVPVKDVVEDAPDLPYWEEDFSAQDTMCANAIPANDSYPDDGNSADGSSADSNYQAGYNYPDDGNYQTTEEQLTPSVPLPTAPTPTVPEQTAPQPITYPNPAEQIKTGGFNGFLDVYHYFRENGSKMPQEMQGQYNKLISAYVGKMLKTDPEKVGDGTLFNCVQFFYSEYCPDALNACLGTLGMDSLGSILNAGRPYWEAAFRYLQGQK